MQRVFPHSRSCFIADSQGCNQRSGAMPLGALAARVCHAGRARPSGCTVTTMHEEGAVWYRHQGRAGGFTACSSAWLRREGGTSPESLRGRLSGGGQRMASGAAATRFFRTGDPPPGDRARAGGDPTRDQC